MNKDLIINSASEEVNIALLENRKLVELHKEKTDSHLGVGDIFLGKIRKLTPGLNAAFVNIGEKKDAFLHYLDLGLQINSVKKYLDPVIQKKGNPFSISTITLDKDIDKEGKISGVLSQNQQILVQIAKESISSKGPRVTTEITLAGRYLILIPFSNRISVSQKIKNDNEKIRLKRLLQSIKPNNFGVIIRTVAENKKVAELDQDLRILVDKWEKCINELRKAKGPGKIIGELNKTSAILRDLLNESFSNIHVNNPELFEEIKTYIKTIAPDKIDIVKLYTGKKNIFEEFEIDKQIKNSFGKTVTIKNGAYLIIEHTEALHVIDVNSGYRTNSANDQETNALEVNLEATTEIARQLRLRDIGGIIVIDFIDLHDSNNRKRLFQKIREEMKNDRAKHTILPPNKFGIIQITRQRVRPETNIDTSEKCPVCDGTGKIRPSMAVIDDIENSIKYLVQQQNEKMIKLSVSPMIYAYVTKGIMSVHRKWVIKFKKRILISSKPSYHIFEYRFFNKNDEEIKL